MNIFYTSPWASTCASDLPDKLLVKMVLETAQLLCTAHRCLDAEVPGISFKDFYKSTHQRHPSALWVMSGDQQYHWTHRLLTFLCQEYELRYGRVHKVESSKLLALLVDPPILIPFSTPWTEPPACMPSEYQKATTTDSYQHYLALGKAYITGPESWARAPLGVPGWFEEIRDAEQAKALDL